MLYIIPIIFLIVYNIPNIGRRKTIILTVIPVVLLSAFRYGYGADYFSYKAIYVGMEQMEFKELFNYYANIDFGFKTIMFLSNVIGLGYQFFNVMITLLIIFLFLFWIHDITSNSKEFIVGLFVFYCLFIFVWGWSAMRQGIVLSVGTYFLFNPRFEFSIRAKSILIIFLSTIHISSLFYFLLIFIPKTSKKNLLLFVSICVFFSLLPIDLLFSKFSGFPIIGSFITYLDYGDSSIFSFSKFIRLIILCITLFLYDDLYEKMHGSSVLSVFVVGFGLYFITSFSPVAAGRLHVFSYVLIVPIIIASFSSQGTFKSSLNVTKICICLFCFFYLFKETKTMAEQSMLFGDYKLVPYVNIFNKENFIFDNRNAYLSLNIENSLNDYYTFEKSNNYKKAKAKDGDTFISVKSNVTGYYGVINQNGEVVIDFAFHQPLKIYGNVIQKVNVVNNIYGYEYFDIVNEMIVDADEISSIIAEKEIFDGQKFDSDLAGLSLVNSGISDFFNFPDDVGNIYLNYFHSPYDYQIFSFTYYERNYMMFLDNEMNPIIDKIFLPSDRVNYNGFLVGKTDKTKEIYNSDGVLIWIEKR